MGFVQSAWKLGFQQGVVDVYSASRVGFGWISQVVGRRQKLL
jgi:hypothetical protein